MTFDFDDPISPLDVESLLTDALKQILSHEDPVKFLSWMERNIAAYDTGEAEELERSRHTYTALAATIGRSIWNATPLPGNNYQPRPLPSPALHDLCFCGSGAKYKDCCANLPEVPAMTSEEIWPALAPLLSKSQLDAALNAGYIPMASLIELGSDYGDQGHPRKGISILEPLFADPINETNEYYDYALNRLCNLYDDSGFEKKKLELLNRIINTTDRSPLRAGAWQRLAAIFLDQGQPEEAWAAFHNAQRDNPDAIDLGVLEVQLLIAEHKLDQARARAQFWVKRLQRQGLDNDDIPLSFLRNVINDPELAMGQVTLSMSGDSAQLLHQWLEHIGDRPLPTPGYQAPIFDSNNADMGSILVTPEHLNTLEQDWKTVFGLEKPMSTYNLPFEAEDVWYPPLALEWLSFLEEHPESFDSINILDDIATGLIIHDQGDSPWFDDILLKPVLLRARKLISSAFSDLSRARLPWLVNENRPALRCLARLSTVYFRQGDINALSEINTLLLNVNPDDNHGFRMEQMNLLLRQGNNQAAVNLANTYPDDPHPETTYGKVLGLFRLGQLDEAHNAAQEAIERLPFIVRFLTHKRVKKPKIDYDQISYGGEDQAWLYRSDMRDEWEKTPGVFDWLKKEAKLVL